MKATNPRYVLFLETESSMQGGTWRFILKSADGSQRLEAADFEPEIRPGRLELLAAVRGLEALDGPSRVTLYSSGTYLRRGAIYGLDYWRRHDWTWERFGQWVPVKNADLWQRLARALEFHQVEFKQMRLDVPPVTEPLRGPHFLRRRENPLAAAGVVRPLAADRSDEYLPEQGSEYGADQSHGPLDWLRRGAERIVRRHRHDSAACA